MKRSVSILVGLITLLVVSLTVCALSQFDLGMAFEFMKGNAHNLAVAPVVIVSSSITPDMINDLKVKFGHIKIITVVVEQAVLDIDELTEAEKNILRKLGVDVLTLCNKELDKAGRLESLSKLNKVTDEESLNLIALLPELTGKEITPAEQYQFLVKRPDRGLIKMLLPLAKEGKLDEFSDKAVKNLVVGGDMDSLDDGIVFMGLVSELKGMISPEATFLSKA